MAAIVYGDRESSSVWFINVWIYFVCLHIIMWRPLLASIVTREFKEFTLAYYFQLYFSFNIVHYQLIAEIEHFYLLRGLD